MKRKPHRGRRRVYAGIGSALTTLLIFLAVLLSEYPERLSGLVKAPVQNTTSSSTAAQPSADSSEGLLVYFLDVGQGDSELIRIPDGAGFYNILIDTGEYEYADGLTEMLKGLGVERIDRLICTHPHSDHMGCMARIVQRFEIGTLHMPQVSEEMTPTTSAYEALLDAVLDKELAVEQLCVGAEISCPGGVKMQVLAPEPDAQWEDLNNYSGVIRMTYGKTSFMFTGDAETASEKLILKAAEANGAELAATVLKCGHHGSKTSSSAKFLKAVCPQYVVISCGTDNSYGHPHKATMEKLEKLETEIYRTDEDGTILAKSDGTAVTFETNLQSVKSKYEQN